MGRKGSWFSAIKRVFIPNSKEKPVIESEKIKGKEKKKGRGILKHGETKSFLFREPSSIEKILGEVDQQKLRSRPATPALERPKTQPSFPPRGTSPRLASPRAASPGVTSPRAPSPRDASPRAPSPRDASPRAPSQRVASPRFGIPRVASPQASSSRYVNRNKDVSYRPGPTLWYHHLSAIKIQAAYRGYMARRSFRALKGLVRLQGVVRGQNVQKQTANAMKMMQLLVRVQTQIQSRRIQMLENQSLQRQPYRNDKESDSSLGKWELGQSEAGNNEYWDDSLLTKEEIEARMQKKAEALFKRERAMAYAYSHQLWKAHPKSAQTPPTDMRSGGFPWWWNWMERQLPPPQNPPETQTMKSFLFTPQRATPEPKPSPRPSSVVNYKQNHTGFENFESTTPTSTRSAFPARTKQFQPPINKTPPRKSPSIMKYSKPRATTPAADSTHDGSLKDDDSLMSCPPFSAPNYMSPTVSAKAKARASSNPRERLPGSPAGDTKRRFSFPLTPNLGSFKWNKGSSNKDATTVKPLEKNQSFQSLGNLSIDSSTSMPAAVGRRPFNRFV